MKASSLLAGLLPHLIRNRMRPVTVAALLPVAVFLPLAALLPVLLLAMLPVSASGQNSGNDPAKVRLSGAFRPVFYGVETRNRQGDSSTDYTLNARLQLRAEYDVSPEVTIRARLATRASTSQDNMEFVLEDHTPPDGSYPPGTVTFDEFALSWRMRPDLTVTAGRFQARFGLAGIIPKGLDRYYGSNLSIGHTDGLWIRWDVHPRWRLHLVANHNGTQGSTHAARRPLDFDEPVSRVGGLAVLEHREQDGLWVQREVGVSVLPASFERSGKTRSYAAATGRLMMRLPWQCRFFGYWIGGEAGYVPVAPTPVSAGMAVAESRTLIGPSALAWQVAAYANGLSGRHRFGVLYGQAEPQWLVSSSFRPNNTLSEIRYRFTFSSRLNFEARYRFRTDLFRPDGAEYTRQDRDFYARFTWRF